MCHCPLLQPVLGHWWWGSYRKWYQTWPTSGRERENTVLERRNILQFNVSVLWYKQFKWKSHTSLSTWVNQSKWQSDKVSPHLPQVQSDHTDAVWFIDLRIGCVLRVVDLRVDPLAFVGRIVDLSWLPLPLLTTTRHEQSDSVVNVRGKKKTKTKHWISSLYFIMTESIFF